MLISIIKNASARNTFRHYPLLFVVWQECYLVYQFLPKKLNMLNSVTLFSVFLLIPRGTVRGTPSHLVSVASPCYDLTLFDELGIDTTKITADTLKLLDSSRVCLPLSQIVEGGNAIFDENTQRLDTQVPQANDGLVCIDCSLCSDHLATSCY